MKNYYPFFFLFLLYASMAGDKGFEPLTCWFRASRSTNWANPQYLITPGGRHFLFSKTLIGKADSHNIAAAFLLCFPTRYSGLPAPRQLLNYGWGWENRTPTNRVKVCWTNRYSNPQNIIPRHLAIALPIVRFSKKRLEKWDLNP